MEIYQYDLCADDVKLYHETNAVSETIDRQIWKQNHRMLRREMNLEMIFSLESASRKVSAFKIVAETLAGQIARRVLEDHTQ